MNEFLLIIFTLLLFHYLWFLFRIYKGVQKLQHCPDNIPAEKVSIIIPFRNESEHILENLQSLQCQDYPEDQFEIIYVNDFSSDDSPAILKKNIAAGNIRILNAPYDVSAAGKKNAVTYGIQNASGSIIVTTDADCTYNKKWLSSLVKCYDDQTAMIAGPVQYINCKTLFQKMQALEFAGLVITGAGLIGSEIPVISNAANISYRKKIFEQINGFSGSRNTASGDDEQIMHKIISGTSYKIKFCTDEESIVSTYPAITLAEFYQQRKRWAGKSMSNKEGKIILELIIIFLFYLGMVIQLLLSFLSYYFLISLLISFALKVIFEYTILRRGKKKIFRKLNLNYFWLAELFHIPYIIIVSLAGVIGGIRWKGRKIRR